MLSIQQIVERNDSTTQEQLIRELRTWYNNQVDLIAEAVQNLIEDSLDGVRSRYPETTTTREELIKFCKGHKLTRASMIHDIIIEEFDDKGEA